MVEKDTVVKESMKYVGLGNLKDCYKYAYNWLLEQEFNIVEEKYTEKVSGNSKEIEVVWAADRVLTDYYRIALSIKWTILNMTDVEVEIDGTKKNMNKFGELKIDIKGMLEKDYEGTWGKGMPKFWKDTYHKYVVPHRESQKSEEVQQVCQDFKEEMKAFFALTAKR